tara:strand:- start:854 stop:2692 length:1839 start_codon:yes stop_codon:yes gene_type:complete
MDLKITSKLLKYSPADVQSVTYVVEYAEHNYTGEARDAYLEKRLVTPTEKAIAEVIIEGKAGLYVEHHEKDADGKVIEHEVEAPGTPSSVEEGSAYGITKGSGKAGGAMKDYLDKKAKKLEAAQKKQKPEYRNNPAFGDPSHHSNAKSKNEALEMSKKDYDKIHKDFKSDDPKNPRTTKYVPGKGTVSMPVKFKESANAATLNNKPSAASSKIDTPKEKQSTVDPQCENQRSIKAKGATPKTVVGEGLKQARKNVGASTCWDGYVAKGTKKKNGKDVPNCVPANEEWVWDVVDELGDEFDILTEQDLQDVVVEALLDFDTEQNLNEALGILDGFELLTEDYYDSAVKASKDSAKRISRGKRVERMKNAASKAGSIVKKGLAKAGSAAKAGAKGAAKGAVRGAGYATGVAQRAASSAKSEFQKGRERGLGGSSASSSSSSPSSSGSAPTSTGGSAETGTKKRSLLSRAAGAVGRGLKKAVGAGVGAAKRTGKAAGNLGKKVIGKTSRAISKGSDKLARKLGEESTMDESRTDKVRRLMQMQQETYDHDNAQARMPDAASWRDRLAYNKQIMEEPTPEQLKKRAVLKQTKDLTNKGKHKEASELFKKNFPNFGK